jgi:hypothetical protein
VLLQPNKFAGSGGDGDDNDGVKRGFRVYGSLLENLLKISVCLSCLWICATYFVSSDTLEWMLSFLHYSHPLDPNFHEEKQKKSLSQNW